MEFTVKGVQPIAGAMKSLMRALSDPLERTGYVSQVIITSARDQLTSSVILACSCISSSILSKFACSYE